MKPEKEEKPLHARLDALLEGIDSGAIPLEITKAPDFCNYPEYRAAGWTLCVFDDAGTWDYLEWAESPQGERVEYAVGPQTAAEIALSSYSPADCRKWGYRYE